MHLSRSERLSHHAQGDLFPSMLDLQIRAVSSLPIRTQCFSMMTSAIGSTSDCRMNVSNTFYLFQDIEYSQIDFTI